MKLTGKRLGRLPHLSVLWPFVIFVYTSSAVAQAPGTFIPTGNMTVPRIGHTATLLLNGKVLITGGSNARPASAELYDPVKIAGGAVPGGSLATGELYDPSTGTFAMTGSMVTAQYAHTATLLNNGKVLVASGISGWANSYYCPILAKPELYDPAIATFTATGDYADKNVDPNFGTCALVANASATLPPDGKVLIAAEPTAELYDPATGEFSLTDEMTTRPLGSKPWYIEGRTATLPTNGKVLLIGGENEDLGILANAELYDPSTGKFTAIGNMPRPRWEHTATLLRDGTVLVTGSQLNPGATASSELYDPATDTFAATGDMTSPRFLHTATLLMDGRVLLAGGYTAYPASPNSESAELYVPSVLTPAQVVTDFRFDGTNVVAGSSYSVNVSGSNLTQQTFFDVRFISPDRDESAVVLNWQEVLQRAMEYPLELLPESGRLTVCVHMKLRRITVAVSSQFRQR
jgi:Galactose oxidase, central domain